LKRPPAVCFEEKLTGWGRSSRIARPVKGQRWGEVPLAKGRNNKLLSPGRGKGTNGKRKRYICRGYDKFRFC